MAPKGKSGCNVLKKRKAITMELKLEIVKRSVEGETVTAISRSLGFSPSTICSIIKDKKRIIEYVKGVAPINSTVITKRRSVLLVEMERLLVLWIEDQNERGIAVSLTAIQEEARRIYEVLKSEKGEGSEREHFTASRGWFERFKVRAKLHKNTVRGESASADEEADINRVSNVDETGVFWERVNNRTHTTKEENSASDYKASEDRLTSLLGACVEDSETLDTQLEVNSTLPVQSAPQQRRPSSSGSKTSKERRNVDQDHYSFLENLQKQHQLWMERQMQLQQERDERFISSLMEANAKATERVVSLMLDGLQKIIMPHVNNPQCLTELHHTLQNGISSPPSIIKIEKFED